MENRLPPIMSRGLMEVNKVFSLEAQGHHWHKNEI